MSLLKICSPAYLIVLTVIFSINTYSSYGQVASKKVQQKKNRNIFHYDTALAEIGHLNSRNYFPFDHTYKDSKLKDADYKLVDSLLVVAVSAYNASLDERHKTLRIDLSKSEYRRQIVSAKNKKGEKEVWVNYFCYKSYKNLKQGMALVIDDGGNCNFHFKVNLHTKEIYDFLVNGEA